MSYWERLLEREQQLGRPVRVALVGAGQMGLGLAAQIGRIGGIELSAVADLDVDRARRAMTAAGVTGDVESAIDRVVEASSQGRPVIVGEVAAVAELDVDVVIEATGVPDVGASVAHASLLAGHHVLMLNVEADVTVGRYLDAIARRAGVVYTVANGDEPVAAKELVDFAHDLAFEVVCAGKGKNNPFNPEATPTSVADLAASRRMNPKMLASFQDGSKTMIEMAALANATGLPPDVVGMHGPTASVEQLPSVLVPESDGGLLSGRGRVDYAFGPAPGVFVVVATDDPVVGEEMTYLSMGDGPYFCFYRPYHLASVEAPRSIPMAVLDGEPGLRPVGWTAEVVSVAKADLRPGDVLEDIGGHSVRGVTYPAADARGYLPLGLAARAVVTEPIAAGTPVRRDAVEIADSTIASLRAIQDRMPTDRTSRTQSGTT